MTNEYIAALEDLFRSACITMQMIEDALVRKYNVTHIEKYEYNEKSHEELVNVALKSLTDKNDILFVQQFLDRMDKKVKPIAFYTQSTQLIHYDNNKNRFHVFIYHKQHYIRNTIDGILYRLKGEDDFYNKYKLEHNIYDFEKKQNPSKALVVETPVVEPVVETPIVAPVVEPVVENPIKASIIEPPVVEEIKNPIMLSPCKKEKQD